MTDFDIDTLLVVLAGVAMFLAVVMVAFGIQRTHPGFGLWTVCQVLVAAAFVILMDRGHFSEAALSLLVPGLLVVGMTLRLEGLRRFFGRPKLDYRSLIVPMIALVLLAYFGFGRDIPTVRVMVSAAAIAAIFWVMAAIIIPKAVGREKLPYRIFGGLFAIYGAFLLAFGISWVAISRDAELDEIGRPALLALFILVMLFEITWVAVFLFLHMGRVATDLRNAREAAETQRSQLADLLAFLPDATFAVDAERRVVAWNRAAEELTGVEADHVLGRPFDERARAALGDRAEMLIDLALDLDRRETPSAIRQVQHEQGKLSAEVEVELPAHPGRKRQLWLSVTPLRDVTGAVTGAVESIRDISARENAERIIRQREEQYRRLFELSFDGILSVAPDGVIQDANPAACEMLGMTKEEVCAADPRDVIFADAEDPERLEVGLPEGRALSRFTFVRKDGTTLPVECVTVAYCDSLGFPRSFVVIRDITERLEAEKTLRDSEARLLQAQAVAHVGNWEIDLEARSVWLSPEAKRIYGLSDASPYFAFERSLIESLAEDPAIISSAFQALTTQGGSREFEYQFRRLNDGALRTVRAEAQAVKDGEGVPVKLVGAVQDITELRQVESALSLAQHSAQPSGDAVFWIDSTGRMVFVNDYMCELLGYTRDELLGLSLFEVDASLAEDQVQQHWQELRRQRSCAREGLFVTKDGARIPVEVRADHHERNGQEYSFMHASDVSQRKRLEESLRSEHLARGGVAEQAFWVSPEGRFIFVSDGACEKLGYTCSEMLGMTIYDIDPLLSKEWRSVWDKAKKRGSHRSRAVHRTKDGADIPVEVSTNYVEQDGEEYGLLFARDVSARLSADEVIGQGGERVQQSATLEAIGRLAAGIAHDFNNLLTAIMGYGNLILADERVQGLAVQRDAEEIRTAAERASALTQKILAFSRHQALEPEAVELNELLSGMEPRLREILGADVEMVDDWGPEAGFVEVDIRQLSEALVDLATNARDAMPDGGRFILETRNVDVTEDYCELYPDLKAGSYVLLSVSDTGVGMSPEIMGHIFEPFFTTKEPGVGTGLGLPTVYGFIRQSGGFVNVYSEPGEGSTFKIYLPRVPEPAPVTVPAETDIRGARPTGGGETVLVVEDEAPLRRLVARVLGGLGYKVFVAGSGPEALELLDDLEHPPDMLLTDVVLPGGMQGNDVAAAFLKRVPGLPVLYMSGHARDAIVHSGRLDEGVNFIGKPFTPESLAAKIREVLDSGGTPTPTPSGVIDEQEWEA